MKHITDFPRTVVEKADLGITMSDGCRLSARIWMPDDAERNPVPVILEHLPYRKRDGTIARDELTHPWFAGHGYACIRTDMRGNGDSEGLMEDEYTLQELQDACDVIAWAAAQPWCNGKVGMMGISWGGFNGLQVAALRPPALKAVITLCSTVDRYADDIHYKGGCLLGENFGWVTNMLSYSSRPPDPELVGESKWKKMWMERLENQPLLLDTWLRHRHRDEYWKHGSVCEDYSAIEAAVLSIGGWHDGYRNTISHLVENLDAPVKGIVGPWIHKYPHFAAPQPAIGFLQEAKRWWDCWLKDEETGVEGDPDYRVWLMDSVAPRRWLPERPGRWIAEQNWPSPKIQECKLNLTDDLRLSDQETEIDVSVASKQHCGSAAGEYFPFAFSDELPDEQSADDALSICFDGEQSDDITDIVGAPQIALRLSCSQPEGQIAVRLCDLRPDGTSALIAYGVFNLNHHVSHEQPEALEPGRSYDVSFALDHIAYRLPAGHQLRVAISTAYWPLIWPLAEPFTLTIHGGYLTIPIRSTATGDEWTFEPPEGAPAWESGELRASSYERHVSTDKTSGVVTTAIDCDFGERRDAHHGLISGSWMKERLSIQPDDPLSATAQAEWQQTGGRPGQMWRTHVKARMQGDRENWMIEATLEAFENEEQVFRTEFLESIPRNQTGPSR